MLVAFHSHSGTLSSLQSPHVPDVLDTKAPLRAAAEAVRRVFLRALTGAAAALLGRTSSLSRQQMAQPCAPLLDGVGGWGVGFRPPLAPAPDVAGSELLDGHGSLALPTGSPSITQ